MKKFPRIFFLLPTYRQKQIDLTEWLGTQMLILKFEKFFNRNIKPFGNFIESVCCNILTATRKFYKIRFFNIATISHFLKGNFLFLSDFINPLSEVFQKYAILFHGSIFAVSYNKNGGTYTTD